MAVKMIPDGYHTVQPYLMVKGAKRLLEFVKKSSMRPKSNTCRVQTAQSCTPK